MTNCPITIILCAECVYVLVVKELTSLWRRLLTANIPGPRALSAKRRKVWRWDMAFAQKDFSTTQVRNSSGVKCRVAWTGRWTRKTTCHYRQSRRGLPISETAALLNTSCCFPGFSTQRESASYSVHPWKSLPTANDWFNAAQSYSIIPCKTELAKAVLYITLEKIAHACACRWVTFSFGVENTWAFCSFAQHSSCWGAAYWLNHPAFPFWVHFSPWCSVRCTKRKYVPAIHVQWCTKQREVWQGPEARITEDWSPWGMLGISCRFAHWVRWYILNWQRI